MEFKLNTKIFFGEGALDRLSEIKMEKVMIISDPFIVQSGLMEGVTSRLSSWGLDYKIFDDVVPDTPIEKVAQGLEVIRREEPDTIIAIGGGSALDTSKAIKLFNRRLGQDRSLQLVAIPTTSGTGSEVSSYAVIKDRDARKYALAHDDMAPDYAILDVDLVMSLPRNVSIWTGLDVLTHGMEAYVSRDSNDMTDLLALEGIRNVFTYLPRVAQDGGDREARNKMHLASTLVGIAFNNCGLGINHSVAHVLGARYNIPHGKINGMLLPYVMKKNASQPGGRDKYIRLAQELDVAGFNDQVRFRNLLLKVDRFVKDLGVATSLRGVRLDQEKYLADLDEMAEISLKDNCSLTNPVDLTREDIKDIYRDIYKGRI